MFDKWLLQEWDDLLLPVASEIKLFHRLFPFYRETGDCDFFMGSDIRASDMLDPSYFLFGQYSYSMI